MISDEVVVAAAAVATQLIALVVLLLKGRKTEKKVEQVHSLVNGRSEVMEARLVAQEQVIARLAARVRPYVTDADVGMKGEL